MVTLDVTQLGFVAPDIEVKIVDPETGEILGPHQTGELLIKSLAPMKGYLNRPEETKKFFRVRLKTHLTFSEMWQFLNLW